MLTNREFHLQTGNLAYKTGFSFTKRESWVTKGILGLLFTKIKNLIEKDYAKDISLNYVAENVNLTPAYVSYIFKKETGQTLVKYITDVKMMKAKVMLEEGTLKIVQIAKACGYENQSYFNKLFKNYYGITPKQLREKI